MLHPWNGIWVVVEFDATFGLNDRRDRKNLRWIKVPENERSASRDLELGLIAA
jgi:hypothetical protein